MKTIDLREWPDHSLKGLTKGDKLIIENGEAFIILHSAFYSDYDEAWYYSARTEQMIEEDFYGYEYIFVMDNWTLGQIDDVCYWSEVTGAI